MGESAHGMAEQCGLHAGHSPKLPDERGRNTLRQQARIRILRAGAEREENRTESVRNAILAQFKEVEAGKNKVGHTNASQ